MQMWPCMPLSLPISMRPSALSQFISDPAGEGLNSTLKLCPLVRKLLKWAISSVLVG